MLDRLQAVLGRFRKDRPTDIDLSENAEQPLPNAPTDRALARDLITEELRTAETTFWTRWDNEGDLDGSIDALTKWHGWRTALACLETTEDTDSLTFHVDSLVLQDCYQALFADPATESIVYLTGIVLNPCVRTLNRYLELDHTEQSAVRAEADPKASFETLFDLQTTGHEFLGHGHNHPGTGEASTEPSATDRATQHRLEANGLDAIGLIFTEDGYVRFFSNDFAFNIEVNGNHVRQTGQHIFRLEDPIRTAHTRYTDA